MTKSGLILFAHGARDPRWREPLDKLQQKLTQSLNDCYVKVAFLELMEPSLIECLKALQQEGVEQVTLVPIFLGQGGHIRKDLPKLIAQCQEAYPNLSLRQSTAIGESDAVLNAIAAYCADCFNTEWS